MPTFLDLPRELRLQILRYAFENAADGNNKKNRLLRYALLQVQCQSVRGIGNTAEMIAYLRILIDAKMVPVRGDLEMRELKRQRNNARSYVSRIHGLVGALPLGVPKIEEEVFYALEKTFIYF